MLRDRLFKLETIAVIIVAVFLVGLLMIKPIIGVADNGDFERIMITTGLEYKTSDYNEKYFNYVNREYLSTSPFVNGIRYFSSTLIFVLAAKFINSIVLFNKGIFDIRFLAVLYCCMLLLFIYLLAKHAKNSVLFVNFISIILTLLLFNDGSDLSYFNSLY